MTSPPTLTFDMDGVLCRPPFGINPGAHRTKVRRVEGRRTLLHFTEPYRYFLRRPMEGAVEGFRLLSADYDCRVLTARTEQTRRATEGWFRRWFGMVPALELRTDWRETPAAFKARKTRELGALAHFEDDPHTAAWVAEGIPAVMLLDWRRNRWLDVPNVHRIHRISEAAPLLAGVKALADGNTTHVRP
jgi:hypothetical protein